MKKPDKESNIAAAMDDQESLHDIHMPVQQTSVQVTREKAKHHGRLIHTYICILHQRMFKHYEYKALIMAT
jgi:hypothetical protein